MPWLQVEQTMHQLPDNLEWTQEQRNVATEEDGRDKTVLFAKSNQVMVVFFGCGLIGLRWYVPK